MRTRERVDRPTQLRRCGVLLGGNVGCELRDRSDGRLCMPPRRLGDAVALRRIDRQREVRRDDVPHGRGQGFVRHQPSAADVESRGRRAEGAVGPRDEFFARFAACPGSTCATSPRAASAVPWNHPGGLASSDTPTSTGSRRLRTHGVCGKCFGHDVAVERVPAAQLQHVRPARVARKRAAERAQGGHQIGARPLVRGREDFVDGLRLGIHDQAVEPLERLREQGRAATRDVKDDPDRRRVARRPADAVPGDVHDPLLAPGRARPSPA